MLFSAYWSFLTDTSSTWKAEVKALLSLLQMRCPSFYILSNELASLTTCQLDSDFEANQQPQGRSKRCWRIREADFRSCVIQSLDAMGREKNDVQVKKDTKIANRWQFINLKRWGKYRWPLISCQWHFGGLEWMHWQSSLRHTSKSALLWLHLG